LLNQDTGNEPPIMLVVLSYIRRDIFNEMSKEGTDKTYSSFLFDSREFHQRYLVALKWTWCELVVWVSSGVGWIKQRCSRGRKGQHGHGSGVCRSQISRINYCNVSYQFPPGLCQLCTNRGKAVKLPERKLSEKYLQFGEKTSTSINTFLRLILLWLPKSLTLFSEIYFCRYFLHKLWFVFLLPDKLASLCFYLFTSVQLRLT
jgi:hypothetical protein